MKSRGNVLILFRHEGCIEAIEPHLSTLIPYLINMLNDPKVSNFIVELFALLIYATIFSLSSGRSLAGLSDAMRAGARSLLPRNI